MSGQVPGWLLALGVAVSMLALGMQLGLLAKPTLTTRCAACGRLFRRGRELPVHAPARPRNRTVKTMFVLYASIIVAGLVAALLVGLTQS